MKKPTDFAHHMTSFLSSYLQSERNVSRNTILTYKDTFTLFIRFMRDVKAIRFEKLTLKHLTRNVVLDFLDWIETERKCSIATRNYRLATFKSFARYLQYEVVANALQWHQILCIGNKKRTRHPIDFLTIEGVELLLSIPDVHTPDGLREVVLLSLIYDCGARVSEIINLTPSNLKLASKPMTVSLFGKGRKPRVVNLLPRQVNLLKQYMKLNRLFEDDRSYHPVFFNRFHDKLSRSGIAYILKKNLTVARQRRPDLIPAHFSLHGLRHTKAMHLLEAGWDIVDIRDFLGHSSIKTTDVYTRANNRIKDEALERAYPNVLPDVPQDKEWHNNESFEELLDSIKIYVE